MGHVDVERLDNGSSAFARAAWSRRGSPDREARLLPAMHSPVPAAIRFVLSGVCTIVLGCDGSSMDGGPRGDTTGVPLTPSTSVHDWTRFGWNAARSNASTDSTGIDSPNVATLRRQQVAIDGTVDASAIYLHGVYVNGAAHDVFFVTTTYGKTLAVDAADGSILWRFTPPDYNSFVGVLNIFRLP